MNKTYKQLGIVIVILIIPFIMVAHVYIKNQKDSEDTMLFYSKDLLTQDDIKNKVNASLIDADDFNKKSVDSVLAKYGKPTYEQFSEVLMESYIGYQMDNSYIKAGFPSHDKRFFGVGIRFDDEKCSFGEQIEKTRYEKLIEMTGVEYEPNANWSIDENCGQWGATDYQGWESVVISCDMDGNSNVIYFSYGWRDR